MNYDALLSFATFAEHLNFTRAARELHISQPALHQKVNKLGEQLDTRLYVRNGRDLELTEEGELLAAHARQIQSQTQNVLAQIDGDEPSPLGLASGPGAFLHLLGPAILEARDGPYPLRLLPRRAPDAARAVAEARAHVAVGVFKERRDPLEFRRWREVGQQVVVPDDHRLADRDRVEPPDLAGESFVIAPEGKPHRISTARVLEEYDVAWEVGVEATGWRLMTRFVTYGMGITVVNDFVPVPEGLVGIPADAFPSVDYSVAMRRDTRHDGARWLFERICDS